MFKTDMLLFSYSHEVYSTSGNSRSLSLLPSATLKTEIYMPTGQPAR